MQSVETGLRLHVSEKPAELDTLVTGREYIYKGELVVLIGFDERLATFAYSKDGWATGSSVDVETFSAEAIGRDRVLNQAERKIIRAQMILSDFAVERVFTSPQGSREASKGISPAYEQPPITAFPRVTGEGSRPSRI